jgi:phospholipid/cholesterol/gamma-HCH transport system substrate-binding protein
MSAGGQHVRVGLFLLATLGALIAGILVLSRSQSLFARKVTLHTSFENAGGLIAGSEVRLAGVPIGTVRSVHFDRDPKVRRVDVDVSVRADELDRIRGDSIARVTSKGLLGDAIIDITVGSSDETPLRSGDRLDSAEPLGLGQILEGLDRAVRGADVLIGDVDARVREVITPQVSSDIGRIVHSAAGIAEGVERGPGLAHKLIYEPAIGADAQRIVSDLQRSVAEIQSVLASVRSGNGALHALVYDPKSGQAVAHLQDVAAQLDSVVTEIRTGNGLVHSLIYEQDQKNLIQDLTDTARIIRKLAIETDEGKGTIGALLKDPTIYEDLLTILGNVERNVLLKALIRSTISNDQLDRPNGPVEAKPVSKDTAPNTPKNQP